MVMMVEMDYQELLEHLDEIWTKKHDQVQDMQEVQEWSGSRGNPGPVGLKGDKGNVGLTEPQGPVGVKIFFSRT